MKSRAEISRHSTRQSAALDIFDPLTEAQVMSRLPEIAPRFSTCREQGERHTGSPQQPRRDANDDGDGDERLN